MSCFISEPTPLRALQCALCAGGIVNAKLLAIAVAEIELRQIAMQVRLADVLIDAINAALQDREKALDRVGVNIAAHILVVAVRDGAVRSKIPADAGKRRRFIGHEMTFARGTLADHFAQVFGLDIRHVKRLGGAATIVPVKGQSQHAIGDGDD